MPFELLNPVGLERPVGYSHVAKVAHGNIVFVAGQAPFAADGSVVGKGDFVAQFRQVASNLKVAVEGAGGKADQFAVLTMYVTDVQAYIANRDALGAAYRAVFGRHFPAITLVEVSRLYHPDCMVEISGVAVID